MAGKKADAADANDKDEGLKRLGGGRWQTRDERFTIEQPITMALRRCGEAQGAWLPERRELVICYELVDTLYLLGLREHETSLRPVAPPE